MTRPPTFERFENQPFSRRLRIHLAGAFILLSLLGTAWAQNDSLPLVSRNSPGQAMVSTNLLLTPPKALEAARRAREDYLRGHLESAEKELMRAFEIAPHFAVAHTLQGAIDLQRGNTDGAASDFKNAIDDDPTLGGAYLGMGMVLMDQAKYKEALTPLNRAAVLMPGSWYVHLENAIAHLALGDTQAAAKEAELAEDFAGPDAEKRSGVSYVRAILCATMKDLDGARKYFAEAITRNPNGGYAILAKRDVARLQASVTRQ